MNAKSVTAFTALILSVGLNQAIAPAQSSQAFLIASSVLLQPFSDSSSPQIALEQPAPAPPDRGTPGTGKGTGSPVSPKGS
ncbi:MAG TPA: hypothetical protein V6D50_01910 [Chroococcales cyanobacterium]|jgi:hypothetical protein